MAVVGAARRRPATAGRRRGPQPRSGAVTAGRATAAPDILRAVRGCPTGKARAPGISGRALGLWGVNQSGVRESEFAEGSRGRRIAGETNLHSTQLQGALPPCLVGINRIGHLHRRPHLYKLGDGQTAFQVQTEMQAMNEMVQGEAIMSTLPRA